MRIIIALAFVLLHSPVLAEVPLPSSKEGVANSLKEIGLKQSSLELQNYKSVIVDEDITYAQYGDRSLQLDLYSPANVDSPVPGVIVVHGGGWHMMYKKGKLNPHLDYSRHPKMHLQRKFNLIIFLTNKWKKNWGGETCFYLRNKKNKKLPGEVFKKIYPKFNRAIIFDTSKTSWHSVDPIKVKKIRKTIAVYYLIPLKNKLVKRERALYAPTQKQIYSKKVLNFIKMRTSSKQFSKVYKTKNR